MKAKTVKRVQLLQVQLFTPSGDEYEWFTEIVEYEGSFLRFKDKHGDNILISGSIVVSESQKIQNEEDEEDDEEDEE